MSDAEHSLEASRLELDWARERNRAAEQNRLLSIEESKHAAEDDGSKIPHLAIAAISSVLGGAVTLGGAYLAGAFTVQTQETTNEGLLKLEKLKFANQQIDKALSEGTDKERAQRLKFMVEIGLFSDALLPDKIAAFADEEVKRVEQGGTSESLLPRSLGGSTERVTEFFAGGKPALDYFASAPAIQALRDAGALRSREGLAILLGNLHYETAGFKLMEEQTPRAFIERTYANRMGNIHPEDAWNFRGRGFIMLTGRSNYARFGEAIGVDLVSTPDRAADPVIALRIALAYFLQRKQGGETVIDLATKGDRLTVRKLIAGPAANQASQTDQLIDQYLTAFDAPEFADHPLVKALPSP